MIVEVKLDQERHGQLFESLEQSTRGCAHIVTLDHPHALQPIDASAKAGMIFGFSVSIGSAGPLSVMLQGTLPDVSVLNLVTLDAPPSNTSLLLVG